MDVFRGVSCTQHACVFMFMMICNHDNTVAGAGRGWVCTGRIFTIHWLRCNTQQWVSEWLTVSGFSHLPSALWVIYALKMHRKLFPFISAVKQVAHKCMILTFAYERERFMSGSDMHAYMWKFLCHSCQTAVVIKALTIRQNPFCAAAAALVSA